LELENIAAQVFAHFFHPPANGASIFPGCGF
jgi:hypothetical protein